MTEAEWLASADPGPMLQFHREKASARKARLFAVACCWRLGPSLANPQAIEALAVAERFADGEATEEERSAARKAAREAAQTRGTVPRPTSPKPQRRAASAVYWATARSAFEAGWNARDLVVQALIWLADGHNQCDWATIKATEHRAQADLVREVFGNPFRAVAVVPEWLTWNGGLIAGLAGTIYAEHAFDRLPILADALEDAGCTVRDILDHCRDAGAHIRGCWVLDLLLGKE
jgi:hypothetical protein